MCSAVGAMPVRRRPRTTRRSRCCRARRSRLTWTAPWRRRVSRRRCQPPARRRPPAQARPSSRGWCAAAKRRPRLCGKPHRSRRSLVQGEAFAQDRRRLFDALARSRAETARYRQLVVDIENNAPPVLFGTGAPDDLKLIVGVGPVLERMLHQLGVTTLPPDRALDRARHRRVRRPPARIPGAHPPRRLGDAGARAAPEQVRRGDRSRSAEVTGPAGPQAPALDLANARPGRRAGARLGLQLAGAEDGRRRAAAAHVPRD